MAIMTADAQAAGHCKFTYNLGFYICGVGVMVSIRHNFIYSSIQFQ